MLMFDRITKINKDGGKFSKGEIVAELDINPDLWFLIVISKVILLCQVVLAWMLCGNW